MADPGRTSLARWAGWTAAWLSGAIVGLALFGLAVIAAAVMVYVLSDTDWGRERVRRTAERAVNNALDGHGRFRMGHVSGNLLFGATVRDVAITDSAGKPFVAAASVTASYSIVSFLRKRIWLDHVTLTRPVVVLDHQSGKKWNFQRIFPRDTTPEPPSAEPGWGDWISFTNVRLVDARLTIRSPWHPTSSLSGAARDSAIESALAGRERVVVERIPGGVQKIIRLESMTVAAPLLMIAEPGLASPYAQIASAQMTARPFHPPNAQVRDLEGLIRFTDDSAWWKRVYVAFPNTQATTAGMYSFETDDMHLSVEANKATLGDLRWAYPPLPPRAHGRFDLEVVWRGHLSDYAFTDGSLQLGTATATGSFGIALDDTATIHDTRIRFSRVSTGTLEEIFPDFTSPRPGVFAGRVSAHGGKRALNVDADVTFDDAKAGTNHVLAAGELGFPDGRVRARALRVTMQPVRLAMARTWEPGLPLAGDLRGRVTIDGATDQTLRFSGRVEHLDRGARSVLQGAATVRMRGEPRVDVDVETMPVALASVGRFFPGASLHGSATGPVHVSGSLGALRLATNLWLPDRGRFSALGTFDLARAHTGYDFTARFQSLDLRTVSTRTPRTDLTGRLTARGQGLDPPTMHATITGSFASSHVDTIGVDTASIHAQLSNGLLTVEHAYAEGSRLTGSAQGTFGLTRSTTGTLTYRLALDSLGGVNRWLPPELGTPPDTLAGSLRTDGRVTGNLFAFDVRGHATGTRLVAGQSSARGLDATYTWTGVRSERPTISAALAADSLRVNGFAFDSATARVTYAASSGKAQLRVVQDEHREYAAHGAFSVNPARTAVDLASLTFRFDSVRWSLSRPASVRWGPTGIHIGDLELRNRRDGRVYVNGLLPATGRADMEVDVRSFPLSNVSDMLQTRIALRGTVDLYARMTGPVAAPAVRGQFTVAHARYNGTRVPQLRGRVTYGNRVAVAHTDVLERTGRTIATVDGRIPIDLAPDRRTGFRLLSAPASIDLVADSLPLELIPEFTNAVSNVHGDAGGRLALRGPLRDPTFSGSFRLRHGTATITATGATIEGIAGAAHVAGDVVHVDSIVGQARGPIRVEGTLAMANWREPTLDLHLTSHNAELLRNRYGRLRADAALHLSGPFRSAYLTGSTTITEGVVYVPAEVRRHVISPGDPSLFNVVDTAVATERDLFPAESPLLSNLRVDVTLSIRHDTWVRDREANVEVYTDDPVSIHAEHRSLSLTGVVSSDRGSYNFLSKRFQIKRGAATFVGGPELDPAIQAIGEYQVELPSRGALNIRVLVGGTLRKPTLSLESDAQPPRTQSELLSLLAFGQTPTALLATGSSSIAGSAATSDLFGVGAQVAARRLAGVALGVAASQVELEAGRAFGTDVFEITPSDIPSGNIVTNLFVQTKFEAGKYVNPRTFVTLSQQAGRPGFGIEHRTGNGWLLNGDLSPRIILGEPRLTSQPFRVVQVYGGFVLKEWRF